MGVEQVGDRAWIDDYNQLMVNVHLPNQCRYTHCTIHNPSQHRMIDYPQRWRQDLGIMERMCPHGVGHPDPDEGIQENIHFCDGCCGSWSNIRKVEISRRTGQDGKEKPSYVFKDDLADAIFSKKLLKSPLPYGWDTSDVQDKYDSYNEYSLNSYNCRGPEFINDVDFIFAGCSQTFGIGVPDDGVWPKFVSDELGGTYVNLSMLGAGMEWIADSIYRYIHTFGRPKRGIMILAPDVYRMDTVVNNTINSCPDPTIRDYVPQYYSESDLDLRLITYHLKNKEPANYLKRPFPIEETAIEEESIRRTVTSLRNLEIFCNQVGIPLIWATWSDSLYEIANTIPDEYKFDNYLNLHPVLWRPREDESGNPIDSLLDGVTGDEMTCHASLSEQYGVAFPAGTDRFKFNDGQAHMGVHRHIHVAQDFIEKARSIGL